MRKFTEYSLGVLCCLSAAACYAADKFEVLPELPSNLLPPAEAATVTGISGSTALGVQTVGHEPNFISVAFSLLFVILLIYLTGILYAKLNKMGYSTLKKQQGDLAKSQVSVLSTTQLGNNKTLHVVELDGKRMLIGASTGTIQLIKDLGNISESSDNEYSHIEIPNIKIPKIEIPKIEIPSIGFSKLVSKACESDNEIEETEESDTEDNIQESNSDEILSSLYTEQEYTKAQEETTPISSEEHSVDPDEYSLYKKYIS